VAERTNTCERRCRNEPPRAAGVAADPSFGNLLAFPAQSNFSQCFVDRTVDEIEP
jgi:hypothetical protein